MQRIEIVAVVILVAAAGIGGYFFGSYAPVVLNSPKTSSNGVELTQSRVDCLNNIMGKNYVIDASFYLGNTLGQS